MSDWKRLAGAVLMVGFEDLEPDERIRLLGPAGVILFSRNLASAAQTRELTASLQAMLHGPALFALDQEGGRVSRLEPFIGPTPAAEALARAGAEKTRKFGLGTGRALTALGFNIDFAPVVDLCGPGAENGIGNRSFGTDAELVSELAGSFLEGLQAAGVAGCLKHFPGLGRTAVDSHLELPVAEITPEELLPYRRLGSAAPAVMVGHAHYPAINPGEPLPASCSREVVGDMLRKELGYDGLVVSDDLEMGAVSELDSHGEAAVRALTAGCDLLLYCKDLGRAEAATGAIARAAEADPAVGERLEAAAAAVRRMAERWPGGRGSAAGWDIARRGFDAFSALC